jgi:hypothetical protein
LTRLAAIYLAISLCTAAACSGPATHTESTAREDVAAASDAVVVDVYWDQERGPARSRTGFLHGIEPDIPRATLEPLRPSLFRRGNRFPTSRDDAEYRVYERAIASGATYEYVLSDGWGYDRPWTLLSAATWALHVFSTVRTARALGMRVAFDVWNEPNDPKFWSGNQEQFLDAFWIAVQAAKLADPKVMIGGPSLSWFDARYVDKFLRSCAARGIELSFLSWHETDSRDAPDAVVEHAAVVRQMLARYPTLQVSELHVNEWGPRATSFSPGVAIAYFSAFERAAIDRTAHSHWAADWRLAGLVTAPSVPRAVYWAWRAYAQSDGVRVTATSSVPDIAVIATKHAQTMHVLLGSTAQRTRDIVVRLHGVDRADLAYVALIPAADAPMTHAPARVRHTLAVERGAATVVVRALRRDEAAAIDVTLLSAARKQHDDNGLQQDP